MSRRKGIAVVLGGLLVMGVLAGVTVFTGPSVTAVERYVMPRPTSHDLERVARARIFFAHQSVGQNVLDGVRSVYTDAGLPIPRISEPDPGTSGIDEVLIGTNGDPMGKIKAFDAEMRHGEADRVDVAVLKLCYVDVDSDTDVEAVFRAYRDTLTALQRDFPSVAVVAATVPLSSQRDFKRRIKSVLGRDTGMGPADNVARERLNALIREQFGAQRRLFDIAAAQSTGPDGQRPSYVHGGAAYYAMLDEYSADPGHLNAVGSEAAAAAFLAVVSDQLEHA
jgi:hypothetical protein